MTSRKKYRKRVDSDSEDDIVIKSHPVRLSSTEQQAPDLVLKSQRKSNSIQLAFAGPELKNTLYDIDLLKRARELENELLKKAKSQNINPTYIPGEDAINTAREKRNRIRELEQKQLDDLKNQVEPEFISLQLQVRDSTVESRLIREDDEAEENKVIHFNPIDDTTQEMDLDDEDQVVRQWELNQINLNSRIKVVEQFGVKDLDIPDVCTTKTKDVLETLEQSILELEKTIEYQKSDDTKLKFLVNDSLKNISGLEKEVVVKACQYDYFQELGSFIVDYCELMDEKEPELEIIEKEINSFIQSQSNSRQFNFDSLFGRIDTEDELVTLTKLDQISSSRLLNLFANTKKGFGIDAILSRFKLWQESYPKEYGQAYGSSALPGVLDIYIRQELAQWNPFEQPAKFHDLICIQLIIQYFPADSTLMVACFEGTVVPFIRNQIKISFDPVDHHRNTSAIELIEILVVFIDIKSHGMQDILDSFEDKITLRVHGISKIFTDTITKTQNLVCADTQARNMILDDLIIFFDTLLKWKKYFPASIIHGWAIEGFLNNIIIPILDISPNISDLEYFIQIGDLVKDLIPDVYSTPTEFKLLEVTFLRNVVKDIDGFDLDRKDLYRRSVYFLSSIKSFEACALLSKKSQKYI